MMAFFIVFSIIFFCNEQLFAFPLRSRRRENTADINSDSSASEQQFRWTLNSRLDRLSLLLNISSINNEKTCTPRVLNNIITDMGCKYKIIHDFQDNRIPQLLPQVKCISSLLVLASRRNAVICEEVKYNLPVLYHSGTGDSSISQCISSIETLSISCIRSRSQIKMS